MPDLTKAINDLLQIHEALMVHVRLLVSSIDAIVPLAAKSPLIGNEITLIHENLNNFGLALFYMKEGEMAHENMDYETLKYLINETEHEEINSGHARINNSMEQMQDELHYSDTWNMEQINEHLAKLQVYIRDFRDLVVSHARRENELLKCGLPK